MLAKPLSRRRATAISLLLLSVGCARNTPPQPAVDPTTAAVLEVFSLARERDPEPARLGAVFGPFAEGVPSHLYDALRLLADARDPRVVHRETMEELAREVIDIEADLAGGGSARYSVQLDPADESGGRRVTWFQGPGVAWPPHRTPRGEGLSSSPIE